MSEYKFKVGDKVKVPYQDDDEVRTIVKTDRCHDDGTASIYPYELDSPIDGYENYYCSRELKLVENEYKFTVGDYVLSLEACTDIREGGVYAITREGNTNAFFNDDVGAARQRPAREYHLLAVGDRVKVVQAAQGAYGANGKIGVVTKDKHMNGTSRGLHVAVDGSDKVWGIGDTSEVVVELLPAVPESTTEGVYTGMAIRTDIQYPPITVESLSRNFNTISDIARDACEPIKHITKEKKMSAKYYRVKKDTPAWNAGAILQKGSSTYKSINDLWDADAVEFVDSGCVEEYAGIVENSPEWFERVYEVGVLGKTKYLVKDAAQSAYASLHKPGKDKE